jgi:hypothetical protein
VTKPNAAFRPNYSCTVSSSPGTPSDFRDRFALS